MSNPNDVLAVLNAQQEAHTPNIPSTPVKPNEEWMPGGDITEWPTIREEILINMEKNPRGLQKTIGPSELGTTCLNCLARKLTWMDEPTGDTAWLPFIGTAVHARFEEMFTSYDRYLPEYKVTVGTLTGPNPTSMQTITGSIDLFDIDTATTIDWKIVGNSTLDDVRRHGPSQQYRIQASLYGIGINNDPAIKGSAKRSCIYFLPRNQPSLDAAVIYEMRFDPQPGVWALNRAQTILSLFGVISSEYGWDTATQWVDALPRDPRHCFHCRDRAMNRRTPDNIATLIGTDTGTDMDETQQQLADRLPAMPRALLKVPQAEYKPQPTTTPNNDRETQS